jgi:hypothetical protein
MSALQKRSADLQSAVSQNCILRSVASSNAFEKSERSAEFNSAIQQITNLRYFASRNALLHFQFSGAEHSRAFTGL